MGCCNSNRKSLLEIEDQLEMIESKLKFKNLLAKDIDKCLHKYSKNLKISETQFLAIVKHLNLDVKSEGYKFIQLFYNKIERFYSVIHLSTIVTLYSKENDDEKINLLFRNYDLNTSGFLERSEVEDMINDITSIGFIYICNYAISKSDDSYAGMITEYKSDLLKIRFSIVGLLIESIMGKVAQKISMDDFKNAFNDKTNKYLLEPCKLRNYARNISEKVVKTMEIINKNSSDGVDLIQEFSGYKGIKNSRKPQKRRIKSDNY